MAEVSSGVVSEIIASYKGFLVNFPLWLQDFINLFLLVVIVVGFCVVIWKFYTILSRKNILRLNIEKYNKISPPFLGKIIKAFLLFLEYVVIIPIIIFFWFAFFTLFLTLLTEMDIGKILIISAICISAIRMTAYYKEDLSRELAIMLTLDLLVFAMLLQSSFNFEKIIENLSQLSVFFGEIIIYLAFIAVLEIFLRIFSFIFSRAGLEEEEEKGNKK